MTPPVADRPIRMPVRITSASVRLTALTVFAGGRVSKCRICRVRAHRGVATRLMLPGETNSRLNAII